MQHRNVIKLSLSVMSFYSNKLKNITALQTHIMKDGDALSN